MLFSGAPAAPAHPSTPLAERKPVTPVAGVANKRFEITHEESKSDPTAETKVASKPEIKLEPKPALPARTPIFSPLNAKDEEVEIPSWLRPLSNNSATVVAEPAPVAPESSEISTETVPDISTESESADSPSRSEAAVFGGQLLGGETAEEPAATSGSKKGLFLGLAAAAALVVGGFWYYRQTHPAATNPPVTRTAAAPAPASGEPIAATNASPAATTPSRPANSTPASTPGPLNTTPTSNRNSVAASGIPSSAAAETRGNNSTAERSTTPAPEPPKKSSLGAVHLATPVVKASPGSQSASGEPLLSVDAPIENSGTDALAEASHHKSPAAPLPIGGDVKPAQLIKSVPPVYPQMAKTQRISGNVTIDALIDASGNVAEVKVVSGPPLLHRAALDAVKLWKYTPAQLDGSPTAIHLTVTVQFRTQ
jgi:TonB family protein